MRVPVTKADIEFFVEDVFPDKPTKRSGRKVFVDQVLSEVKIWLSEDTIRCIEELVLQGDPEINKEELKYNIIRVQFFCDDFINELVWIGRKKTSKSSVPQKKVVLYDAFELSIFCLANFLRISGQSSGSESVDRTSWICVEHVMTDMKLILLAYPHLQELVDKKFTNEIFKKDEKFKYVTLKARRDDLKKKIKKKLDLISKSPKGEDSDFKKLKSEFLSDKISDLKDFRRIFQIGLHR